MSNKIWLILLCLCFCNQICTFGYELDMSVDEEIKKKYNSSQLNYDVLPALPKASTPTPTKTTPPKAQLNYSTTAPVITKIDKTNAIKLSRWTKFKTKSNQAISDYLREGSYISFTTTSPVYKKNITIPAGSKLTGLVVNSHRPQITGNGGLVVIRMTNLTFGGKTYEISGKITKANTKKVFLNNIKGKRQYWTGVDKQINKGENFYNKSRQLSNKFSNNPILVILSPIPTIVGVAGYAVNTVISPLTAIGTKGGSLSIPAGSQFEIKLTDDAYISK